MSRERMSVALNRFGVDESPKLFEYDWHGRLMFGTDLPVWQAHDDSGLAERSREYVRAFRATGLEKDARLAFRNFCQKRSKKVCLMLVQLLKCVYIAEKLLARD